jgi:hypothetical protein
LGISNAPTEGLLGFTLGEVVVVASAMTRSLIFRSLPLGAVSLTENFFVYGRAARCALPAIILIPGHVAIGPELSAPLNNISFGALQ